MHTFLGERKRDLFSCVLVSENGRLILECVSVKYLRSLSSHVYRFISKITKSKTHRRGKIDGGRAVADRIGSCTGTSGNMHMKNQIQPVLTWSDVSWLGLLQQDRRGCAQTARWLWHSFCTTRKGIDLGPQ